MNILFLCTYNAGRSLIAEAILNRFDGEQVRGFSAGEVPKAAIPPMVQTFLTEQGYSLDGLRPKHWREFLAADAPRIDLAITLCNNAEGEMCMSALGHAPVAHWDTPDPNLAQTPLQWRAALDGVHATLTRNITELLTLPEDYKGTRLTQAVNRIGWSSGWTGDELVDGHPLRSVS
ncbi:arsenate reductase ArsC [Asticcacaulis sp. EMRT-3]|uniref:arsenate-mycothiol transferase ArsC n=1 Tax=Asticcacaulis sp. EMRT-3 TaxID=3040349 RepID=UPI0024AEC312|nr:arsenate reductase ArsC [Asticcacaulis sp. EMRT-3]MDI7776455.1 arsenate reductase ArsC [Asticcacaulis sp. EMRT-3]